MTNIVPKIKEELDHFQKVVGIQGTVWFFNEQFNTLRLMYGMDTQKCYMILCKNRNIVLIR